MASVAKREWTYKGEPRQAFVVRYRDGTAHRSKQFDRKKDADEFRKRIEREQSDGVHVAQAETKTVSVVCDEFLRDCEDKLRDGRIGRGRYENLKSAVKLYIKPAIGAVRFADLKWGDADKLRSHIRSRGVAPFTLRRHMIIAVMVEQFAARRGYCKRSVISDFRKDLGSVPRSRIQTFSAEEVAQLVRDVETERKHAKRRPAALLRCFVHLGTFCTLRWGEIAGLTLDCVDLDRRFLRIRHSLTPFDEHKTPKTAAGNRDVPLPRHVVPILRAWIDKYYVKNERRLLFRLDDGSQLKPDNFRNAYWYPLLYRNGLSKPTEKKKRHFHALRHFAASQMVANHLPLPEIASVMGHATFDITLQTYVHSIAGGQRRSAAFDGAAEETLSLVYARSAENALSN